MTTAPSKEERKEYARDCIDIDGKKIHKNEIKRALTIAELVEALHSHMPHRDIDPPLF